MNISNIITGAWFDVPDDDFDKFQTIFSTYDTERIADAVIDVSSSDFTFSRVYTDDEIKSILVEDADLNRLKLRDYDNLQPTEY
jgi:hypothetical protein